MNSKLIEQIKIFSLNEKTNKSTIKSFLNTCISSNLYESVEGNNMDEKVEYVYNFLSNIKKEPVIKSKLNLVIADDSSSLEYVDYLNKRYEVVIHKTKDIKNVKDIDLVLFTGGEDVNPSVYGEKQGKHTSFNDNRDYKEIATFNLLNGVVPFLGICRGNQLLTVLSGGKLIQHVENHGRDHNIVTKSGLRYKMTSSHHQMIYPFNLSDNIYDLIAYSEHFQSHTYLNGDNIEIDLSNDFLEPEIVYYKNTNSLCIQGHPEWYHCEERTSNMCLDLIDKYLVNTKKESKNLKTTINEFYLHDELEEYDKDYEENKYEEELN